MNSPVYAGVFLKDFMFSGLKFSSSEDISTDLIDALHDIGFTIKPISEEEYQNIGDTKELSLQDLIESWQL